MGKTSWRPFEVKAQRVYTIQMKGTSKIFVAGHRGLVGSAVCRELHRQGFTNVIVRSRSELDLLHGPDVQNFFEATRPEYVVVAAAKVGGIMANSTYPAMFLWENLQIQNNIIEASWLTGAKKLLFLGSSCIYPRLAPQPLKEEYLLTGPLEPTNEWYAVAKIAGIKLCQALRRQYGCDFISAMPTNLYGPGDNYEPQGSHVLPALIRKFHDATIKKEKQVVCWGTGAPLREFLHSDDLARALVCLLEHYSEEQFINVGSGTEVSIRDLSSLVAEVVGFTGVIEWDTTKPDGTPRKLMDSSRMFALGWKPTVGLREGIASAYKDFQSINSR